VCDSGDQVKDSFDLTRLCLITSFAALLHSDRMLLESCVTGLIKSLF
jgi:hypothetical protein